MILDSSALVAIVLDERDRPELVAMLNAAPSVAIGAPTLVEAGIVVSARTGEDASALLTALIEVADAVVIDFGPRHWQEALSAWLRFGRSRHPAGLNFGDCLAYATARVAGEPLLATGGDFARTDIELAWPRIIADGPLFRQPAVFVCNDAGIQLFGSSADHAAKGMGTTTYPSLRRFVRTRIDKHATHRHPYRVTCIRRSGCRHAERHGYPSRGPGPAR